MVHDDNGGIRFEMGHGHHQACPGHVNNFPVARPTVPPLTCHHYHPMLALLCKTMGVEGFGNFHHSIHIFDDIFKNPH